MNLIQMEYFLEAAREGNFTTAAKQLYVSQPALSKQIALLETELKTQLFFREHRNVSLTPPGQVLYEELTRISDSLQRSMEAAREAGRRFNQRISIGCLETISTKAFLLPLLQRFQRRYPDYRIDTGRYAFRELIQMLGTHQLDFIFTLSFEQALLEELGYTCCRVEPRQACLVCSPSYVHAEQLRRGDLALEDAVLLTISRAVSAGAMDRALDSCRNLHIEVREVVEVPNVASLISNLVLGRGIAFLDRSAADMAEGALEFHALPSEDHLFFVICAWNRRHLNQAGSAFRSLLVGCRE